MGRTNNEAIAEESLTGDSFFLECGIDRIADAAQDLGIDVNSLRKWRKKQGATY